MQGVDLVGRAEAQPEEHQRLLIGLAAYLTAHRTRPNEAAVAG
ncbi:hypothetical protein [Micromonospora sp. M42]|nr:hypothetical protein [Micromonospora sp. M42]